MTIHLVDLPARDAGLLERTTARVTDLTWLARDAAAAALMKAAEKMAPGTTCDAYVTGFGGHVSARMVAVADNPAELDMLLDRSHGALPAEL